MSLQQMKWLRFSQGWVHFFVGSPVFFLSVLLDISSSASLLPLSSVHHGLPVDG